MRSAGSDSAGLGFRRVEVKSVKSAQTGRIFLTVNEYHRARQAGADYVLRIVEVPEVEVRQEGVRLVAGIEDPVGHGELERKIVTDVRGGGYIPLVVDLKDMS